MESNTNDFVSKEPRTFRFKVGHHLASSLAGFVAGAIVASIIWGIGVWYVNQVHKISAPTQAISAATQ